MGVTWDLVPSSNKGPEGPDSPHRRDRIKLHNTIWCPAGLSLGANADIHKYTQKTHMKKIPSIQWLHFYFTLGTLLGDLSLQIRQKPNTYVRVNVRAGVCMLCRCIHVYLHVYVTQLMPSQCTFETRQAPPWHLQIGLYSCSWIICWLI